MTSVRVIVTGEVQGVGFRNFVMRTAKMNDVMGWARNVGVDMVEILLQGESDELENVIALCYMGPDNAVIENVHVEVEETRDTYKQFEIRASVESLPS